MLKFSKANAKIEALKNVSGLSEFFKKRGRKTAKVYSLDLLSGYSCPFAEECLSRAVTKSDGRRTIRDGKKTKFRCFSASQEAMYPNVYNIREHNFNSLRKLSNVDMVKIIHASLPDDAGVVRIHVAGDFFSRAYMMAWYYVALMNPETLFYAYTKSLRYWVGGITELPTLHNFVLTASYGGRDDHMIDEFSLRSAKVVFSETEADSLGLAIDHDDSHAANPAWRDDSFALLIHGTQPAGSDAATALKQLKGKGSYSRKKVKV